MNIRNLLLQLILASLTVAKSYTKTEDAILLSKVRSLTLQNHKQTTARRVTAIPQLTCVGGNAKSLYEVDVMQCANSGSEYDAEDIQWTCRASLPPEFKLGSTEVVCEGFDSSDDSYVLKGSCGVEYRLILTQLGEEKYGSGGWFSKNRVKQSTSPVTAKSSQSWGSLLFSIIFWTAFVVIVLLCVNSIFQQNGGARLPRNPLGGGGGGGFWGGGGGGGDDDPPPPYTPRAPPRSKPSSSTPRSSRSTNSGPGFWTGAGVGAAGGYAAGNYMANRNRQQEQARQQNMFGAGPSTYNQGGSSWFGGGGGGGSPAAGPSTTPSSSRYESSGFGGTRRR